MSYIINIVTDIIEIATAIIGIIAAIACLFRDSVVCVVSESVVSATIVIHSWIWVREWGTGITYSPYHVRQIEEALRELLTLHGVWLNPPGMEVDGVRLIEGVGVRILLGVERYDGRWNSAMFGGRCAEALNIEVGKMLRCARKYARDDLARSFPQRGG